MTGINLEMWFPQQQEVLVLLEAPFADPAEGRFCEVLFFALYATRQLANLREDPFAQSLAKTLACIDERGPVEDVMAKLGDVHLVSLANPSVRRGIKGFQAEFKPEKREYFELRPRGFGRRGVGVGDCASTSTLALLAHLLDRRSGDTEYLTALVAAARLVGTAGLTLYISVSSSSTIAMQAADAAWAAAAEADYVLLRRRPA